MVGLFAVSSTAEHRCLLDGLLCTSLVGVVGSLAHDNILYGGLSHVSIAACRCPRLCLHFSPGFLWIEYFVSDLLGTL